MLFKEPVGMVVNHRAGNRLEDIGQLPEIPRPKARQFHQVDMGEESEWMFGPGKMGLIHLRIEYHRRKKNQRTAFSFWFECSIDRSAGCGVTLVYVAVFDACVDAW